MFRPLQSRSSPWWLGVLAGAAACWGQGKPFSYQGRLTDHGLPATGAYDLRFVPFAGESGGEPLGPGVALGNVGVTNGLFQVWLDFGPELFRGEDRWLEVGVRPGGAAGEHVTLQPRQRLGVAPQAAYADLAGGLIAAAGRPLEFWAEGQRVWRLEPRPDGPNVIAGFPGNAVAAGVAGATIAGGGGQLAELGTVATNYIAGSQSAIGGGAGHTITGYASVIGGGIGNRIEYEVEYSVIGGGLANTMRGGADSAVIAGGYGNSVQADFGILGGGRDNLVGDGANFSIVGGGLGNVVEDRSRYVVVAGGANHEVRTGAHFATVAGGEHQIVAADAAHATIGGGLNNQVHSAAKLATISGGEGAKAVYRGQWAYANGMFSYTGDAQTSVLVLRRLTLGNAPTALSLDGGPPGAAGTSLTLPLGSRWAFDILVVGGQANGVTAAFQLKGVVKNVAGATSLVGVPAIVSLGADPEAAGWSATVRADDVTDTLVVEVQGAESAEVRWVAQARTVELVF